jgi:excisionase family DNA binding protein
MKGRVPDELLFTVKETAAILRVRERTIWKMIATGRLRVIRPRGLDVVRIPRRVLVAMLGQGVLDEVAD